nr:excinuclease ABC subunit UvrA [Pseudomonadota bacterium]
PIIDPVIKELKNHLKVINSVGLNYLSLDRDASTISGGEAQRLRLAKALGSPLSGVCYILDEPSIGLHPQDQDRIMDTLFSLKKGGNTVIVVEHDEETIRLAEHVVDIGPKGGANGGHLVVEGTLDDLLKAKNSLTADALRKREVGVEQELKTKKDLLGADWISLKKATCNNLKNIDVEIPLGKITVVAGVSGAGKSSLVRGCFIPAAIDEIEENQRKDNKYWQSITGLDSIKRLIELDQTPIGKTITSTPASYLGVFDLIRKIYASLPEAKMRGYTNSYFSFNSGKGRCLECSGKGVIKIPMSFLPDAITTCEACNGQRYNREALEILYQGFSIGDILKKTIEEAADILKNHKLIKRTLDYVIELGLGYISLGQPTYTLSGGEAQRLKIATELGMRDAENTIYILDEPTIGLHMSDVDKLLSVVNKLKEKGNTIIIIEHNLDVMRASDYLIEIGPGPGEDGGKLLFSGAPNELAKLKTTTPTKKYLFNVKGEDERFEANSI